MDTQTMEQETARAVTNNKVATSYSDWLLSQQRAMKMLGFKNADSFKSAAEQLGLEPAVVMPGRIYYARADVERVIDEKFGSARKGGESND